MENETWNRGAGWTYPGCHPQHRQRNQPLGGILVQLSQKTSSWQQRGHRNCTRVGQKPCGGKPHKHPHNLSIFNIHKDTVYITLPTTHKAGELAPISGLAQLRYYIDTDAIAMRSFRSLLFAMSLPLRTYYYIAHLSRQRKINFKA